MRTRKIVPLRKSGDIADRVTQFRIIEQLPDGEEKECLQRSWYEENRPVALDVLRRLLS